GDVHEFLYRLPTNQERIEFQNRIIQRKGGKVLVRKDLFSLYVEFGALVLTGFKPGTLSVDGKIISSDSKDDEFVGAQHAAPSQSDNGCYYYADWKDLLQQAAPDMLAVIGRVVFSGAQVAGGDEVFEIAEDNDQVPLAS
ncbi:MAG: hypothetical protein SVS15_10295, partial [Thermodesulfobacteriota bacterium]|nr:hypothetical protein [Thermodesulfobacteriota bacterium]